MGKRKEYDNTHPRVPAFYERFRKIVNDYGSVSKVAEITGISVTTINFWYNGQRVPGADSLRVLSEKLGVSSDFLLGLIGENNATNDVILREVTEYTGLSNAAIIKIKNDYHVELLSRLLSDDDFVTMINDLDEYVRSVYYKCKEYIDTENRLRIDYPKDYFEKEEYKTVLEKLFKESREYAAALYEKSEEWIDIIENVFPPNGMKYARSKLRELIKREHDGKH